MLTMAIASKDLTPNFDKMAADPDTTVFKNVYNASTPTITGTLAELCSYLPPTGHEEIHKKKAYANSGSPVCQKF